jgi:hypothetical protein
MIPSKMGSSTPHVPHNIDICTPLPSLPLHPWGGEDTGPHCASPTDASFTFPKPIGKEAPHPSPPSTPKRQCNISGFFTTPSLTSSPLADGFHGYNTSGSGRDEPLQTIQPHDPVSNNNKGKTNKNEVTTIYTQNAQGLWHHPRDPEGNILVNLPPDLSKLEYLFDFMHQNDVGAWLIQETWEEGDDFDVDVGGYHIF